MATEFDEALWGNLVDHLTVTGKDDIVFTVSSGIEIKEKHRQEQSSTFSEEGIFYILGAGKVQLYVL